MILRFREGSALHAELKRIYDVREATYKEACDIIEELVGERPEVLGYCRGWGFTCAWNPHMVAFKDGFVPDPKLMSENTKESTGEYKVYKVLRTTPKGREASAKFRRFNNSVTSDGLEKLGLPLHAESRYFYFMPSRDEAGYYLAVSNSIIDVLKKNVDITIEL
jgi:hypothetical protein